MGRLNLLLDLDGTLTDSRDGIVRSIEYALEAVGVSGVPSVELDACVGPPLLDSLARLLGPHRSHLTPEAAERYERRYAEAGVLESRPYDGIRECLAELQQLADLYVVTSNLTSLSRRTLAHLGLDRHFRRVHGCRDWGGADKAGLIEDLLKIEALDPASAVMVGDRLYDMQGARKNGIGAVGILWGYGDEAELLAAGAEVLCEHPSELVGHFRDWAR